MELKEALEQWDAGEPVRTIEMGGISPGYEQAIQVAVFEMVRVILPKEKEIKAVPPEGPWPEELTEWMKDELHRIDRDHGLGLSGAQASAILNLSSCFVWAGYEQILNKGELEDRLIMASK